MSHLSEEYRQALKSSSKLKCYVCHGVVLARERETEFGIDLYCKHCDFAQQSFHAKSSVDFHEMLRIIGRR